MEDVGDEPSDMRPIFYVFFATVLMTSAVILGNVGWDLKTRGKTHLALLLGLSLYDFLGAVGVFFIMSVQRNPIGALCETASFFVRLYLMATATFVTLLSLEHFLSLVAPFWYEAHVSVKNAAVVSVVTSLALLSLNGISFLGSSVVETLDVTTNATRTRCEMTSTSAMSAALCAVLAANVLLTLGFSVTVIRKLLQLRRARPAVDSGQSEEMAVLRLVLGLSVVSVVTNLPAIVFGVWRLVDQETAEPARLGLNIPACLGCVLNPVIFLVCTARYRRRVRGWVRRVVCLCQRPGPGEHNRVHPQAGAEPSPQGPS